ncbi:MAG: hypothetical protein OHK0052_06670 [Anaerolineales bacterium]
MTKENMKFSETIQAPMEQIFECFTNSASLREWLCDEAEVSPVKGGRVYFWWRGGYSASGEFVRIKPNEKVQFSWNGRGEPGKTLVKVYFELATDGATIVTLKHEGLGEGKAWRAMRRAVAFGWQTGLRNLKALLETGADLRIVERPALGIIDLAPVSAEEGAARTGLRLGALVADMPLTLAGVQPDDVLTRLGGKRIRTFEDLQKAMTGKQIGDEVKATLYRADEKMRVTLTLKAFNYPQVPPTPNELAQALNAMHTRHIANLKATLKGISDEQASYKPNEQTWSIKQTLAHLVTTERDLHGWLANAMQGNETEGNFASNLDSRLNALLLVYPTVRTLLTQLEKHLTETAALAENLPDELCRNKRRYWHIAFQLMNRKFHFNDHLEQLRTLIRQ